MNDLPPRHFQNEYHQSERQYKLFTIYELTFHRLSVFSYAKRNI